MLFSSISRNFAFKSVYARVPAGSRSLSSSGNGDIRGAGGSFGRKEKAQEEQYFRKKEKEELEQFKKVLEEKDQKIKKTPQEKDKKKDSENSKK